MIRTLTNMIRALLFQASCPSPYWAEALNVATHIINILPTKTLRISHHTKLSIVYLPHTLTPILLVVYVTRISPHPLP